MKPVSGKRIMASAQRGFRRGVKGEFRRVADQIGGLLGRMAGGDDVIPIQQESYVRKAAREAVERMFISPLEFRQNLEKAKLQLMSIRSNSLLKPTDKCGA